MSQPVLPPTEPSTYVEDPQSACTTAADKINVVLMILRAIEDPGMVDPADTSQITDDGGQGIYMVQDLLLAIRDDLRDAAARAQTDGGAR